MSLGAASGGDVSGIESSLESLVPQFSALSSQAAALSPIFEQQGQQDIYPTALNQYQTGATGQITPNQQAAVNQTLQQQQLQNASTYANLGLGGSTMQTQDANANAAKSLAQTQGFSTLDETLGLSGLTQAGNFEQLGLSALTGAGQILGGATGALQNAGSLATTEQATQLGLLGSLGSAIGGSSGLFGSGGLFGGLGSLFGGGSSAGATAAALGTGGLF